MKKLFVIFVLAVFLALPVRAEVMATLDGISITGEEVDAAARGNMIKIMSEMYDIKRGAIEEIIDGKLLERDAKQKGMTVDKLKAQIQGKAPVPTSNEARSIYEIQKKRYQGKTFEEVEKQLLAQLTQQKRQMALYDHINSLRGKAKIKINLERPKVEVSVDDDPAQGAKNAPITLIEFSEFQCPYCKKARPTLDKIMATYAGKIHYVFRDFPLGFHDQAKMVANAANCANEQGKYWDYNKRLWEMQGQGKFTIEKIKALAVELKLDTGKFNSCADSNKYFDEIEKDIQDGAKAGVSGTPAYFINGKFLSGAQPFENFQQIIEEELAGY